MVRRIEGRASSISAVLMFKNLVLQAFYNLSDDQAEVVFQDRLSFMRFLGLCPSEKVPDAKTIWPFRESLVRAGAIDNLFARFGKHLSRSPDQGRVGHGVTRDHSMTDLNRLRLHGRWRKIYLIRGKAIGLMPTLTEVLENCQCRVNFPQ